MSMGTFTWSAATTARWFTLPVDGEADHYRLLAYMQRIDRHYREHKLYPYLDDLHHHLEELKDLRRRRDEMTAIMPRDITGIDLRKGEFVRAALREDALLKAVDTMIDQRLPELNNALGRGVELRARLTAGIRIEPVGLLPLYTREGYLLIHQGSEARVYTYALTLPTLVPDIPAHHVLRTHYVADYSIGITCTYEHVKADLMRSRAHMPNPAVFALTSDLALPAIETFVPLAKQLVYELVSAQGS